MFTKWLGADSPKAVWAYLGVCFVWGSTYVGMSFGAVFLPPLLFAGLRYILTFVLCVFVVLLVPNQSFPKNKRDFLHSLLIGFFMFALSNGLVNWMMIYVDSGLSAISLACSPLMVAFMEAYLPGGKRLAASGWFGLLLGIFGILFIWWPALAQGEIYWPALPVLLFAAFCWALGAILSNRLSRSGTFCGEMAAQSVGGMLLFVIAVLAGDLSYLADGLPLPALGSLLYLVCIGTGIGYFCFLYVLQHMPPAKAVTYAYVNPLVAMLLGALLLHDAVTWRMIIGGMIILAGVALTQKAKVKENVKKDNQTLSA